MNASERKRPLIAISDDEPTLLFLLASELEAEGYDVTTFEDKQELLDRLSFIKPDAIITDIKNPSLDGFEFVKAAKSGNLTKQIPIIVVTAYADVKNAIEMQKLGAADFMSKPYELDDILGSLRRVLKETFPNVPKDESSQRQVKAVSSKKSAKSSIQKIPVRPVKPRHPKGASSRKPTQSSKPKTPVPAVISPGSLGKVSVPGNEEHIVLHQEMQLKRFERVILHPLFFFYLGSALYSLLTGLWLLLGVYVLSLFFHGVIRSGIHQSKSFSQFGYAAYYGSNRVAILLGFNIAAILPIVGGWGWYVTIPIGFISIPIILILLRSVSGIEQGGNTEESSNKTVKQGNKQTDEDENEYHCPKCDNILSVGVSKCEKCNEPIEW